MTTATRTLDEVSVVGKNRRLGWKLALVGCISLALSPLLYMGGSALCVYFGVAVNPDSDDRDAVVAADAEGEVTGRNVKVFLKSFVDKELRGLVKFDCEAIAQTVEVGRYQRVEYTLENISNKSIYIRPVHQVSPPQAAVNFMMIECFCYNDMELKPGVKHRLPVVYGFKPEMDVRIRQADVLYSLHPIAKSEMREKQGMPDKGPFKPQAQPTANTMENR